MEMNYEFRLSGENIALSKYEAEVLLNLKGKLDKNILKIETGKKIDLNLIKRLAYTKKVFLDKGKIYENKEKFGLRRAHLRPGFSPVSLNPKLARCLVNLTGTKTEIVDCFCGTGGILIEAGLIGLRAEGYDTDREMLKKCELNLRHFKIKNYKLIEKDALKITKKIKYLAADLPYGKNTKTKEVEKLYDSFLNKLNKILVKKAAVVFPDFVNCTKLVKKNRLKIEKEFSYYVHKSMTKKIVLIKTAK